MIGRYGVLPSATGAGGIPAAAAGIAPGGMGAIALHTGSPRESRGISPGIAMGVSPAKWRIEGAHAESAANGRIRNQLAMHPVTPLKLAQR